MKRISFAQLCIVFFVLLVIALAGSLTSMELRAEEPRRAIVAMEMIMGNEWIIPKIHGTYYYNKPPLFNWLMAGVFLLTGSYDEISVRLPSLLAFLLTAYLVFRMVKKYADTKTGIIASILLLTSADILFYGAINTGEIDLFFALLVFLQAIAVFYYSQKQKWLAMFVLSYIATAAGVLTKFLPALLFQAVTLLVWLSYIRQFKKLFSLSHLAGIACCVLIAGSYFFVYSTRADVGKFLVNLINESTQQSGLESNGIKSLLTFLQSPLILFYITLPGSLLLFYLMNKPVRSCLKNNPLLVFSILFIAFNIPPYIITAKIHNRYLYPLFPFAAIVFSCIYFTAKTTQPAIKKLVGNKAILCICLVMVVARIGYNIRGIPYQQKTSAQLSFRKLSSDIFAITKHQPVHITGKPDTLLANPSLPFLHIDTDTLLIPPFIQPQVPYYGTRHINKIMKYDKVAQTGIFYIVPVSDLPGNKATVYKYFEGWNHRPWALAVFH